MTLLLLKFMRRGLQNRQRMPCVCAPHTLGRAVVFSPEQRPGGCRVEKDGSRGVAAKVGLKDPKVGPPLLLNTLCYGNLR